MHYGVGEGLEFGQVVVEVGGHVPAEVPAEFSCVLEQVELVLAPIEPRGQDLIALQGPGLKDPGGGLSQHCVKCLAELSGPELAHLLLAEGEHMLGHLVAHTGKVVPTLVIQNALLNLLDGTQHDVHGSIDPELFLLTLQNILSRCR